MQTGSIKFENGRESAIYGKDIRDHVIMGYVLDQLERYMHNVASCEMGNTDLDAIHLMVERLLAIEDHSCEGSMADFDNFNIQHTLKVQLLLFECIKDCAESHGIINDEYYTAINWCIEACLNQQVYIPGCGSQNPVLNLLWVHE